MIGAFVDKFTTYIYGKESENRNVDSVSWIWYLHLFICSVDSCARPTAQFSEYGKYIGG